MLSIEFIDRVREIAGLRTTRESRRWTVQVLCAVFHTIADPEMQRQFCSKLPRRLHEIVSSEAGPRPSTDRASLVSAVAETLALPPRAAEHAVRSVYRALLEVLSPAEAQFLRDNLQADVASLFVGENIAEEAVQETTWGFEERSHGNPGASPILSGGDVDARWDLAESSGEETVGASVSTPDQSVVEELGEAIGITYTPDEELRPGEKEADRDHNRWELDPASAEDYESRNQPPELVRSPFVR